MTTAPTELVGARNFVDDVRAAVDFCTTHLGFTVTVTVAATALADVRTGLLRLLLSGPATSRGTAGPTFRSDPVSGFSGHRVLLTEAADNLTEPLHPAPCPAYRRQHIAC
jgi:hypothetical protein